MDGKALMHIGFGCFGILYITPFFEFTAADKLFTERYKFS